MSNTVSQWMSWEGGVDLAAQYEGKETSMVLVHVAAMVHTPVGSAPAGMVLFQDTADSPPSFMGFISTDQKVADYFGPHIFAGTPFEQAPGYVADMSVTRGDTSCSAEVKVGDQHIQMTLNDLGPTLCSTREPSEHTPFREQILERTAGSATLIVNGEEIALSIPATEPGSSPAVAFTPTGIYSR